MDYHHIGDDSSWIIIHYRKNHPLLGILYCNPLIDGPFHQKYSNSCRVLCIRVPLDERPLKKLTRPKYQCKSYVYISYIYISYNIISYHIISYHIISYHIISYHIISYHIIYIYTYIYVCYKYIYIHNRHLSMYLLLYLYISMFYTGSKNPSGRILASLASFLERHASMDCG